MLEKVLLWSSEFPSIGSIQVGIDYIHDDVEE